MRILFKRLRKYSLIRRMYYKFKYPLNKYQNPKFKNNAEQMNELRMFCSVGDTFSYGDYAITVLGYIVTFDEGKIFEPGIYGRYINNAGNEQPIKFRYGELQRLKSLQYDWHSAGI